MVESIASQRSFDRNIDGVPSTDRETGGASLMLEILPQVRVRGESLAKWYAPQPLPPQEMVSALQWLEAR